MERQAYLEQLIAVQGNQTVKVVTGIRRSGKSYLLNVLYRDYLRGCGVPDSHVIQVALDLTEFAELRDPRKLQRYVIFGDPSRRSKGSVLELTRP